MRFSELCDVYLAVSKTTKRLEKTALLVNLLKATPDKDMADILMLLKGRVYPEWEKTQIGISGKLAIKAIALATGESETKIVQQFKKLGDIGEVAQALVQKKKQHTLASQDLDVEDVVKGVRKLAIIEGTGSVDQKLKTIAQLLSSATPLEARFLVRILLEDLRVGIADGTIRDAIVLWAAEHHDGIISNGEVKERYSRKHGAANTQDRTPEEIIQSWQQAIQDAIDRSNDVAKVAVTVKHKGMKGLESIELEVGMPFKVMLAQKETNLKEAMGRVGTPCALEYKYDGFRMEIHKDGHGKITLYTRRLENVTTQFPDVVACVKELPGSFILDAEAVGYDAKTGRYTAFQQISQRIRRKYDIEQLAKDLPVELNVFDILSINGKQVYTLSFTERRKLLEGLVPNRLKHIKPSTILQTDDEIVAERFYKESLAAGNEGIMLKSLDAPYKPGSRVGFMVKLKPVMDTLDVVIVGAEWGEGKRSGWLTSFIAAIRDDDGEFVEIGRFGTGLKEKQDADGAEEGPGSDGIISSTTFEEMTKLLQDDIVGEEGKEVRLRPNVVVELKFEEIQASPSYSSGFALRFPRFVQLRDDRRPEEISTLSDVIDAFERQRGRTR